MRHQKFDKTIYSSEQDQRLQKAQKQGRKRRNEPKNAKNSNEQS